MANETAANLANPNFTPTERVRVRFAKVGVMKFVGHLDTMRFFQKAIRRAGLPIAYSNGFHPHQILSFALPLGVGLTTEGDYLDMELTAHVAPEELVARLDAQMAEGVSILAATYLPEKAKKAMAAVEAARYRVRIAAASAGLAARLRAESASESAAPTGAATAADGAERVDASPVIPSGARGDGADLVAYFADGIRRFYEMPQHIPIVKKTKKSERALDLKPLIEEFTVQEADDVPVFTLTLSAGSTDNIKPELVMAHFLRHLGLIEEDASEAENGTPPYRLAIHRLDLLTRDANGRLVSLGAVCEA